MCQAHFSTQLFQKLVALREKVILHVLSSSEGRITPREVTLEFPKTNAVIVKIILENILQKLSAQGYKPGIRLRIETI